MSELDADLVKKFLMALDRLNSTQERDRGGRLKLGPESRADAYAKYIVARDNLEIALGVKRKYGSILGKREK